MAESREIWPRHEKIFLDRAISIQFALMDRYRSIADNQAKDLGFGASLPRDTKTIEGLGICAEINGGSGLFVVRLRLDYPLSWPDAKKARYLSRDKAKNDLFLPHTTLDAHKSDPTVDLIITESELKATSIAENLIPKLPRPTCVIGLQGVNGGWHREKQVKEKPDGTREKEKTGDPLLIPAFDAWNLKKRRIYLMFDSDVASPEQVEIFRNSYKRRAGLIGAEHTLKGLLEAKGADVWITELPGEQDGSKNGPDDFIVRYGWEELRRLLRGSVKQRNLKAIEDCATLRYARVALSPPPPIEWTVEGLLQPATLVFDVGDPASFKTWTAIHLGLSVARGREWLGRDTRATPVFFIEQESDENWFRRCLWKAMRGQDAPGDIPFAFNTELFLNLASDADRARLAWHITRLRAGLVIIDSWSASLVGVDENSAQEVQPIINALRAICRSTRASILVIHHTNRAGGFRGSQGLLAGCDLMLLRKRLPENIISYQCEKTRSIDFPPFSARANFNDDFDTFSLSLVDSGPSAPKLTPGELACLDLLAQLGPSTIANIGEAASANKRFAKRSASAFVYSLVSKGLVVRVDSGGPGTTGIFAVKPS